MTRLRQMMLEELERRNYDESTIRHYIRWVEQYARFFGKSPEKLGPDHLRTYQAYLLKTRKLSPGTVENHVAALRFLYVRTLKRYEFREYIPYPRVPKKLPGILSKEEVARLINSSGTLFNRTLLMLLYGTGMRRSEAARLKWADIDSQRMIVRVVNGKGGKDRDLPLSPALLETMRAHWRCFKPATYLFPSRYSGALEKPITDKAVWQSQLRRPDRPASASGLRLIRCVTAGRRTCSKTEPICAPYSCCSATRIWRQRPDTCTFRPSICSRSPTPSRLCRLPASARASAQDVVDSREQARTGGGRYPPCSGQPVPRTLSALDQLSAAEGVSRRARLPHRLAGRTLRRVFQLRSRDWRFL